MKDRTEWVSKGEGVFHVLKDGVMFEFRRVLENSEETVFLERVDVHLKIKKSFENSKLPIHLVGELAQTATGVKYLRDKKAHLTFIDKIQSKELLPHETRAALWSLGLLGCSNKGMSLLK